jgi:hypothetical protein
MDQTGLRNRGVPDLKPGLKLAILGEKVDAVAEALLGDPMPTTKGAAMGMQFGEWWNAFLKAPYDKKPFYWPPYLITMFICFLLATIQGSVTANVASYSTTALPLDPVPVALVTFVILLIGMSVRTADGLPQYMAPYLAWAEWWHGHIGLVVFFPMLACMIGGAALRYVPLGYLRSPLTG